MTAYSDITPLEPEWLWAGRIIAGGVTIVAAPGGTGKGMLLADVTARVTTGRAMPDGTPGPLPGSVVMVSAEDDPSMAVAWRLRAAGADLQHVHDFGEDFTLPGSLPRLRELCGDLGDVRMAVVDPLAAVAECGLTASNVKIRATLFGPAERFARQTGIAVVLVHHTVKSGQIAGSKSLTDAARLVLSVERLKHDPRIRVVRVAKTNIAADDSPPLAYTITEPWPQTRVSYVGLPEDAQLTEREQPPRERVLAALRAADGPVDVQRLAKLASVDYGNCRVLLHRLAKASEVHSPARGLWTVPTAGDLRAVGL